MRQVFCDYCGKEIIGYKPCEGEELKPGNCIADKIDVCTECQKEKRGELNAVWTENSAIRKVIDKAYDQQEKGVKEKWRSRYLERIEKRTP